MYSINIRKDEMINYENKGKMVSNKKTGTVGVVLCQWNRTTDGAEIVEVNTGLGKRYWKLESVEF